MGRPNGKRPWSTEVFIAGHRTRPRQLRLLDASAGLELRSWDQEEWEFVQGLRPDVAIIPECSEPDRLAGLDFGSMLWTGRNPNIGLAVFGFGAWQVTPAPWHESRLHDVLPAVVRGPAEFDVFGVFAQNHRAVDHVPEYKHLPQPAALIDVYRIAAERPRPLIVGGDFNNSVFWDKPRRQRFASMADRYRELGLVSLYHASTGEAFGQESSPTHWWRDRKAEGPRYHIDYIFLPEELAARSTLHVGTFEESVTQGGSDHAFLLADIPVESVA